jgi:hypothetical protein
MCSDDNPYGEIKRGKHDDDKDADMGTHVGGGDEEDGEEGDAPQKKFNKGGKFKGKGKKGGPGGKGFGRQDKGKTLWSVPGEKSRQWSR